MKANAEIFAKSKRMFELLWEIRHNDWEFRSLDKDRQKDIDLILFNDYDKRTKKILHKRRSFL